VLIGEGRVLRAGRSILFCEAVVTAEDTGELIAKGSGVFKPARTKRSADG
jgi:acyl-coenzyme A thioesterase PaaI-like protein